MASLSSLNFRLTANIAPFKTGLNKAERSMDRFGRKMQQTGKNLSTKLTAPLAAIGAVSFSVFKGFEAEMSKVKAVSGATAEEFKMLSDNAKELGASTMFSAREVASLQTEFAKLGFTATEITKVTEGTLALAQASGSDLARAAEVAGSTLRAFGLDASETGRVTDVMAKSFSTSALDMETFAESMKYVAPVANSAGMSIEETSAMLAVLANSGIKGAQAGTSLRRIISEIGASGKPTSEALKDLANQGLNLADAKDEVGRSAQSALLILSKGVDQIKPLTKEFENAKGSANSMAKEMGDNAYGATKRLESAMEGLGISVGEIIAIAVVPLIENLAKLAGKLNNASPASKKFAVVLGAIVAAAGPLILITGSLIRNFVLMRHALIKSTTATKIATAVTRAFNLVLKANPIGVTIGLITSLTAAFMLFNRQKKEAIKVESKLSDSANETISNMQLEQREMNNLMDSLKSGNLESDQRRSIINKLNTEYKDYLPKLIDEKDSINDIATAQKEANNQFRKKIALTAFQDEITQATEKAVTAQKELNTLTSAFNDQVAKGVDPRKIRFYQKDLDKLGITSVSVGRDSKTLQDFQFSLNKVIAKSSEEVSNLEAKVNELSVSTENATTPTANLTTKTQDLGDKTETTKDKVSDLNDELGDLILNTDDSSESILDFSDDMDEAGQPAEDFAGNLAKINAQRKFLQDGMRTLGDVLQQSFEAGLTSGEDFFKTLKKAFTDLAKKIIATAMAALVLATILSAVFGSAGEAGIKAFGAGFDGGFKELFMGIAGSMGGIPGLAEGGIVTGPTLAMIGEGGESEAVIPLSKLSAMMQGGNGSQRIEVVGRISGADILLSQDRAERNRTRQRGF